MTLTPERHADQRVIDALVASGKVDAETAESAVVAGAQQGAPPLQVLIQQRSVGSLDVIRAFCAVGGYDFYDLVDFVVDPAVASLLDDKFVKRESVLPLAWEHGKVLVAVPFKRIHDIHLRDTLTRLTGRPVKLVVAQREDIQAKINKIYRAEGEMTQLATTLAEEEGEDEDDLSGLTEATAEDDKIVRFVNALINQAIDDAASDIHIEPGEKDLRVRYRIDGVLKEVTRAEKKIAGRLISRLKIMANMNIAEKRVPQDGRLSVTHKGKQIDLRVAALPTVWGFEKVVMRILDNSTAQMALTDLGFAPENFSRFQRSYVKPYGMILVTGPTGSGKSTTLYATVNIVSNPQVNVITVEDPVEYKIAGINQVQVNQKAGMTFAAALKSILRSDPDIVLIGEIRDPETAHIAVEAALTGHLVLSTLHTNDAPSAITRLTEMGIEPFLVGSAIDAVLAQRLCRRLCKKCKVEYVPTPDQLTVLPKFPWSDGADLPTLYRALPGGCNACSGTGYKGRMGLHEVMTVDEDIERLAVARASADEIGRVAVAAGMKTLIEDGWYKVGLGSTSIEEILRVVAT